MMSADLREVLSDALGIGWKGHTRTPWRNRTACNVRNVHGHAIHGNADALGLLVRDPAEDYGKMRVYRVTQAGALAITGKKLPKKLAALLPETKEQAEPLKLAA